MARNIIKITNTTKMSRLTGLFITISAIAAMLTSCGTESDRFRMEGQFKNMNQVDLYLYDASNGKKDTIHVQRGRFVYETAFEDTATLVLMFPNFSQIPIFATTGITVKVKGDASQLREIKVNGSKENEEMTALRLKSNQLTPPEMKKIAADYIMEEPNSPVSFYLLEHYFVKSLTPDYKEASRLCDTMLRANPHHMPVQQLRQEIAILKNGCVGKKIPRFALLDRNGHVVTNGDMQSKVNVFSLWATWNYDTHTQLQMLQNLIKEHKGKVSAMGIGIDASKNECYSWMKRDSIDFPIICDGKMWETPMAKALGLTDILNNIIVDEKGIIIERNVASKDLKAKVEELLNGKKGESLKGKKGKSLKGKEEKKS